MANVQIRNVPDDLHAELRARAAESGKSLSDYLRDELLELARRPPLHVVLDRIAGHEPIPGPPSDELIRAGRPD